MADERDGVVFESLNEVTHPMFLDGALFHDRDHLNAAGAAIFTRLLGGTIEANFPSVATALE